jgi:hypothetical protein
MVLMASKSFAVTDGPLLGTYILGAVDPFGSGCDGCQKWNDRV